MEVVARFCRARREFAECLRQQASLHGDRVRGRRDEPFVDKPVQCISFDRTVGCQLRGSAEVACKVGCDHTITRPPATSSTMPVIHAEASLSRNSEAMAMSSDV